jgi:hypothetical protein
MQYDLGTVLTIAAFLGLIPAMIASRKGHSFIQWWILGSLMFIVAFPVSLCLGQSHRNDKKCPACAEWIKREAMVCYHCHHTFAAVEQSNSHPFKLPPARVT